MRTRMNRVGVSLMALLTVLLMVSGPVGAVESEKVWESSPEPSFHVVRVEVADRAEIEFLDRWVDIWNVDLERGTLEAAVDEEGFEVLRDFGFHFKIDEAKTAKYNRPFVRLKNQTEGIPGYPCYRTVEETLATGAALAAAYPDLAEWIDIGDSWEKTEPGGLAGYDLMVLRLTNETNGIPAADKPDLWVMGAIHSRELVTAETVTRFGEHLLAEYDIDPDVTWLLDHHEIHLLLQTNPDGRKKAETGLSWRKNTNENYCGPTSNDRGADLNRNFDFYWACCGGSSGSPCDPTYRGPSAGSEPETQAAQNYVAATFPDWRPDDLTTPAPDHSTGIFLDIHSAGGDVLTAFGFQDPPAPNNTQIHRLGRKFSGFTGYYARLGSLYPVDGSTKDWAYGRIGIPAYTFELGTEFFQECVPFEETIYPDNLHALLYAARAARAPYTQSSGPEVVLPTVLPNTPGPGETVTVSAVLDDTHFGPGEASPPASMDTIAAAEIYLDVPPWHPGALPILMTAVDGVFDESVEIATVSIPPAGLGGGRHTIFIRAQDSAGYWGTVRAAFLWILEQSSVAYIAGVLTDTGTGMPTEGSVSAGPYSAPSAPDTGNFDLRLPAGVYDVTARAPGHHASTVTGVSAVAGDTTVQDFTVDAFTQFHDEVEFGAGAWTVNTPWAIVATQSHSPSSSWHESPGGNSPDGADTSLESPPFDLRGITGIELSFWHRYLIESGYDYGRVEWSSDGGLTWYEAASFSGTQNAWIREEIPLPALDGAADARIRFRFTSDNYTTYDGWYIDDISLGGSLFSDGFESGGTSAWSATSP